MRCCLLPFIGAVMLVHKGGKNIKKVIYTLTAMAIIFIVASISAFAVEKYDCNIFSGCDEVYSDTSSNGAFAFGYSGRTMYIQSFVPSVGTLTFNASGDFVGVPFLDKNTVCAVYMTDDFEYQIVRINCLNGEVSYVNSDNLDAFNYHNISICNNRLYIIKTDAAYSYVSSYDFNGRHIFDYKFNSKSVNEITTNNGCAYAILYEGSVYRLNENGSDFCTKIKDSSDFYNCGADYLADSQNYIYSLKENICYNNMFNRQLPFAAENDNLYYANGNTLYLSNLTDNELKSVKTQFSVKKLLVACNKTIAVGDNYKSFFIISNSEYKSMDSGNSDTPNGLDNNNSGNKASDNKANDYIFTDDNIMCNISVGTTAAKLKNTCPEIVAVTDKYGNAYSGKLKTGLVAVAKDKSYTIAVAGDITGTGTVSSRDYKLLMQTMTGEKEIFGAYKKAADYNLDGSVDNKDLVLIAQRAD